MTVTTSARCFVALTLLAVVGLFAARPASAETINCTAITSVPAVISTAGVFCLTANVTSNSGVTNAIEIQANNVVFDLNGFKLAGNAGAATAAFGIHAVNRQNITIRNGTIRGFRQAITLEGGGSSRGHFVEGIRADSNFEVGIQVNGTGCVIQGNQIVNTGGTTFLGPNANAFGIYASGTSTRIINNDVAVVTGTGTGTTLGIYIASGTDAFIVNNRIAAADNGIYGATNGKCRDNLVSVATSAYLSCVDTGNNH
jgi:hypothetical protein